MKLKVFYATDGDCLLLSSSDNRHALIDGGRTGTFRDETWGVLQEMERSGQPLDLVVVSHIDADHISGILWLMKAVADWTVFDFQTGEGGNPKFKKPKVARPPAIKKVWHNSWRAQLEDLAEPIEAFATQVSEARHSSALDVMSVPAAAFDLFDAVDELAESIPDGVELRRIVEEATPIPRNAPFKELVLLRNPPHVEKLGKTSLTVIGPGQKHLEVLREEWRKWLATVSPQGLGSDVARPAAGTTTVARSTGLADDLGDAIAARELERHRLTASVATAAKMIEEADPRKVTPPNRASITLLAEERRRTCLLTGDAAEEEILEGLEAAGRIADGRFDCNVLKVQHHGSEFNLSRAFAETVIADHYVFCGDGAHHNPDPSVVKTIVESRLAVDGRPFTLWFNCSPQRTAPSKKKSLEAAVREARNAAKAHPEITVELLDDDKPFFEITV